MNVPQSKSDGIVRAALALTDPGQRAAFLDAVCGGDLRRRGELDQEIRNREAGDGSGNATAASDIRPTRSLPPAAEVHGTMIGRYRLLEQIGQGGMGIVYFAEQQEPVYRRVALKIIKPGMDSAQVVARFEQERQALAMMDHPNIAKVLDGGTTDTGLPYFVMELVRGIPITQYCDQSHLSPRERLELFIPVCRAVQHAHQKGIIHRDLKPSNLLVALYDGQPIAKIIDFGVAKATNQRLTKRTMFTEVGSIVGTIEYMAPEQAELNNLDIDTRADIYSLGVILYELLTSSPPFSSQQLRSEAFTEMLRLIREVDPLLPSTKLSKSNQLPAIAANRKLEPRRLTKLVKGELDWIVMRALEKDRSRRYDTANAFARDIERFLNNEPVSAGPPSAAYRFRKFFHRHQRLILASAAMIVLLIVATAISTWQAIVASRANVVANQRSEQAMDAERRARADRDRSVAAEAKAKQAAETARTEAAISAAVNDFLLNDLLGQASARKQASPDIKADPNLTVKTALDRAARRVAGRFEKQPHVEATVRRTIGWSYRDLGEPAAACTQFELALQLLKSIRDPSDPELLDLTSDVAMVYRLLGRYRESEVLCRKVVEESRKALGEQHPITLRAQGALANCLVVMGKPTEAEEILLKALEIEKSKFGVEDSQTLVSMNTLANIYKDQARYAEAMNWYQHVLAVRKRKLGDEHPDTLSVESNIAIVYKLQGDFAMARQIYERVLEGRKRILGEDHPNTLSSINNIALLAMDEGRFDEAEKLMRHALDLSKRKLTDEHPMTLILLDNIAEVCDQQGRHAEAEELFVKTLASRQRTLGESHPDSLTTMHGLAIVQAHLGKLAEAKKQIHHVIRTRRSVQGDEHPDLASALDELGRFELMDKEYAQAEQPLREALQIELRSLPEHANRFVTEIFLGASLLGQGKIDEAEPMLASAYAGLMARKSTLATSSQQDIAKVISTIIELYVAKGEQDKAEQWRARQKEGFQIQSRDSN